MVNKSLLNSLGNYIYKYPNHKRQSIPNPMQGVEIDYYFMASRFAGSKTEVPIKLWTVVVDSEGYAYGLYTKHLGHYQNWVKMIRERIATHLFRLGLDPLQTKRIVRDIDIQKEGHIIPTDNRCGGDRIGIDGSDELYVRRDKFTFIK